MAMPQSYRNWRSRANDYLSATQSNVDCWADSHVLAMLRHTGPGMKLWAEARDHGFWEAEHEREASQ